MFELAAGLGLAFAGFVSVGRWRTGVLLCVAIGLLQDVLRKAWPGQPVEMTVLVGIFVALAMFGARISGVSLKLRPITRSFPYLATPLRLFFVLVIVQSIAAYVRTGSPIIAGIGLLAYLTPVPAVLLGYHYARGEADVVRFIQLYVAGTLLMGSGIFLSFFGYAWPILRQVGAQQITYAPTGELMQLWPGFFRTPETAAWHLATAICLTITLALVGRRERGSSWIPMAVIAMLTTALLLTGRRKFFVEIVMFLAGYLALSTYFKRTAVRLALTIAGVTLIGAAVYYSGIASRVLGGLDPYFARGAAAQGTFGNRARGMTFEAFGWVVEQNGYFGSGAGTGSQGAQHFGGGSNIIGLAAEGGAGKVLAELGIPGIVLITWLGAAFFRACLAVVRQAGRKGQSTARLTDALVALLIANAAVFTTAHQAFGDIFVLLMLGWMLGFLLATARGNATLPETGYIPPRRLNQVEVMAPAQ